MFSETKICVYFFQKGKGTNVKTLEVYNVKTLEVYNVKTLEVYNVKTLEVSYHQILTGGDVLATQHRAHVNILYFNEGIQLKERRDDMISFIILTVISHAF